MIRSAAAVLIAGVVAASAAATDPVRVKGSSASFPATLNLPNGDKTVRLDLTGAGLRTKIGLGVYAVASYLQEGTAARTADDVVKADAVRLLHLVMERTVAPDDFIGAFKSAVGKSYPADAFAAEFKQLAAAVGDRSAAKGDHVFLVSVPEAGVRIKLADKVDVTIKNPAFARALWEVYLGSKPLDDGLKKSLVGMLPR
ncbi:MAG TPA: chalcone isomerase family protein [Gemmata sp.]|nr:chalcone isomerase family protein [Gemmata sp.]